MKRTSLCLLLTLTACSALEPDVGPKIAGQCQNEDSNSEADVSFTDEVIPMLAERCGCHDPKGGGSAIDSTGFSVGSYRDIMKGGSKSSDNMVVPGDACGSALAQKCSEAPPYGTRMPIAGPYLSASEMAVLRDWIVEGAHAN